MGKIGRGLEMPPPAALDEVDSAPLIMRRELAKRDFDVALTDMLGNFADAERLRRGEQRRFDRSCELVHR